MTVLLPAGIQHGTPEGFAAGCRREKDCPALTEHGMCCLFAHVRSITDIRYHRAKARDPRPAAIARRLGFSGAEAISNAAAEAVDDEKFAQRSEIERAKKSKTRKPSTPTSEPTPKENPMPTPADVAKTSKPLTVEPVSEISEDTIVDAPATPKTPRQNPVTKPSKKRAGHTPPPSASAGFTRPERLACRAWTAANGHELGSAGRIPAAIVDAWVAAGKPAVAAPAPQPVEPPEFDEAMQQARQRAELEQLNREADGEPDLPVVVGRQTLDPEDVDDEQLAEVLHLPDPELVLALDGTLVGTEMAAACVDHDGTARIELIRRIEDGWTNVTRGGEYFPSVGVAAHFDDVVVTKLPTESHTAGERTLPPQLVAEIEITEARLTRTLLPAPEGRPEWADVTIPEDIERARALAVRLEQELAHAEEQLATAHAAVDTVLTKWDDDTTALKAQIHRLEIDLAAALQTANIWAGLYRSAEDDLTRRRLLDEQKIAERIMDQLRTEAPTLMPDVDRPAAPARRPFWKGRA